ncbi:MAG: ATP-dependent helicase [Candidatus Melainabacteria bacterium HGW-Melainabacteria-1]|nr:MAG: ATP-dependent helicase [Candidatus Melainabacteria bacterium HGW-Melainabacteria-1]
MPITPYHAKYFSYYLTRQVPSHESERLSMSLFDASVDLNPHQVEAALFAIRSPLSKGVILADEVGLGKTIEAGLVLCQKWAERKRNLIVICPAALRKQWALELEEKFNLPSVVLDAREYQGLNKRGLGLPLKPSSVVILSYHFANRIKDILRSIDWDLVVIDEAHKLRNAYRASNKIGQGLKWAFEDRHKILLTATPLQNSLLELYGLSTLIDEHLFGDVTSFRAQFMGAAGSLNSLRQRLLGFCKRTLRSDVLEYVRYTKRLALTRPFRPTDEEHGLYEAVSEFMQRPNSYAIPQRQRHLILLILRKLLASSPQAIAGTLETIRERLLQLKQGQTLDLELAELVEQEELESDLIDEWLDEENEKVEAGVPPINIGQLDEEIESLGRLIVWSRSLGIDTKTRTLLKALDLGFEKMTELGAASKALIFTESRRTQMHLKQFLESNGFLGKVVLFSGTNSDPDSQQIYANWAEQHKGSSRVTGSRAIDIRTAVIDHFREHAEIMVATEAAAEGVNLQFCSLVVNYDLPWNPQRIEQRIGRCHRYGQQHDVVVLNFLNERNDADKRVYELLNDKFHLFEGVFGASDEVLGSLESGVDFERRILEIYQSCRQPEEIETAFTQLQKELEEQIHARLDDTQRMLFDHFDEDVHQRLKLERDATLAQLDHFGKRFWFATSYLLRDCAEFDPSHWSFQLKQSPVPNVAPGQFFLISRQQPQNDVATQHGQLYRLSHPLGEYVLEQAKSLTSPMACLSFDMTNHSARIAVVEALIGQSGYLILKRLVIESLEKEEYLLFSGLDSEGQTLDAESCDKLFQCQAILEPADISSAVRERLEREAEQRLKATLNKSIELNNSHFNQARERLERWAEDKIEGAEQALRDTKNQIKILRRQSRQAESLDEQKEIQDRLQKLESQQRRQRREIFEVEDEIALQRDRLIAELEKRLQQKSQVETLFIIQWKVI